MHSNIDLPKAFIELIKKTMPQHLSLDEFITACQTPLRRSIRVNPLKITIEDFHLIAKRENWDLTPIPWCHDGFWIEDKNESELALGNSAAHIDGRFYIQEASSMLPVMALFQQNPNPSLVLDMAAAPGSKTTQIAAYMNNKNGLVANEFSSTRLKVLSANIQRCGITNCALTHFDANIFGAWLPEKFDSILLDAPCSGEGTIRKDPLAMKNWDLSSIEEIASKQKELIESAFHALKPNGELIYSTCTLNQQENQEVCLSLVEKFGEAVEFVSLENLFDGAQSALTPEGFLHIYPQIFDSEGFFVAKIKKKQSVPSPSVNKRLGKFPFQAITSPKQQQIFNLLSASFNINVDENQLEIWQRDQELWLFPKAIVPLLTEIKFSRIGLKLAQVQYNHKKKETIYRWQHQAITALSSDKTKAIELNKEQAHFWYMGRDIHFNENPTQIHTQKQGDVIIRYDGKVIGIGKWVNHKIKNGLPRELVINGNFF